MPEQDQPLTHCHPEPLLWGKDLPRCVELGSCRSAFWRGCSCKAATQQLGPTHSGRSFAQKRAQDDSVERSRQKIMSSKTNLINLRQQLRRARTIVVKVGTKVLVQPDGTVAIEVLRELVKSVGTLRMSG